MSSYKKCRHPEKCHGGVARSQRISARCISTVHAILAFEDESQRKLIFDYAQDDGAVIIF
jgi:hypothetical protein